MIIDFLENLENYVSVHPEFYKAVKFVKENDLTTVALGKHDLGNGSYANVMEYETAVKPNKAESHLKFVDIQVVVSGQETMVWQNIKNAEMVEEYVDEKDVMFWSVNEPSTKLKVCSGMFTVFFPQDLHQPNLCINSQPDKVKKVLFKFPVVK